MKLKGLTGRNNERKDGRAERKELKSTMWLSTILVTCCSKKKYRIEKKKGSSKEEGNRDEEMEEWRTNFHELH